MLRVNLNQGVKVFFSSLLIVFLLLIGSEAINSASYLNQPAASTMGGNYIQYVWIDDVRWAFVYSEDGTYIDSYPDPL